MNFRLLKKEAPASRAATGRLPRIDSLELTRYCIAYTGPMHQMRLQKLVYLMQGLHLGRYAQPLVEDEFEAWMKGPISLKIWNYLKNLYLVFDPIELSRISPEKATALAERFKSLLKTEQMELVEYVLDETVNRTDYELDCLIQQGEPWQAARQGYDTATICREIVSQENMAVYFAMYPELPKQR